MIYILIDIEDNKRDHTLLLCVNEAQYLRLKDADKEKYKELF